MSDAKTTARSNLDQIKNSVIGWRDAGMVNFDAIRTLAHVHQARKFCLCMNAGGLSGVSGIQIWMAIRELRNEGRLPKWKTREQ